MPEKNTAELEAENQAEETVETTGIQADEGQAAADGAENVEKQEESPYAKQLRELREREEKLKAELEEKEKILANKNRAIEAMKKKTAESPVSEDELAEKLLRRLEEKQSEKDIRTRISALTDDVAEREVIERHYMSSIVRTGNIDEDLKRAIAIADGDRIWEQRRNRALEERREDFITSFAGSSLRGEQKASRQADPILAQAEQIVRAVNPDAVKHLKR